MRDVHARHGLEQLAGEVAGRAHAGGGAAEHVPLRARERDQLGGRIRTDRRMQREQALRLDHERDRSEIFRGVVGHAAVQARVQRLRADAAHEDRVAVGRAPSDELGADVAARPGAVFNQHRLAPGLGNPAADDAREHVGDAAGGEGHDVADRLLGMALPRQGRGRGEQGGAQCDE